MQEHVDKAVLILNIASTRYSGEELEKLLAANQNLNLVKRRISIYYETAGSLNKIDEHIDELNSTFSENFLKLSLEYEKIHVIWMPEYEDKLYNLMLSNKSLKYLADMGMSLQAPYFYKPERVTWIKSL